MKITMHDNEVEITGISDFNLERIFECGQCFRWEADARGVYTGVALGKAAKLRCDSGGAGGLNGESTSNSVFITCSPEDYKTVWHDYFDIDRDYEAIRRLLCVDDYMEKAAEFGAGIRILRQDKWEALCSFIISQCNNIPRIKKIIEALCRLCGESLKFDNNEYFTFPDAQTLAQMNVDDLAPIRCGYRAEYIISAAKAVASGELDLETLAASRAETARLHLKKIKGIGDKVADCAMLFGLHMLDTFPRDVWIKRAIAEHYGDEFDKQIFAPYSGIAQQYIFHYARNGKNAKA